MKKFIIRLLVFVLGWIVGIATILGAIVGAAYWAYTDFSLNTLKSWGVDIGIIDDSVVEGAEHDIREMSLEDFIAEYNHIASNSAQYTINSLCEEYGLKLNEDFEQYIPESLRVIPLDELFGPDSTDIILDAVTFGDIFSLDSVSGMLDEKVLNAIGDRPLSMMTDGDYAALLEGVQLGFFTDVKYEKAADGTMTVVYEDPANPTTMELLATLNLGKLIETSGTNGDFGTLLAEDLGNVGLAQFLGITGDGSNIDALLSDKTLGDVLVEDEENGGYQFSTDALMEGKSLGTLMGYTLIMDEDGETPLYWEDAEGNEVIGMDAAIADISLTMLLGTEGLDPDAIFGDMYLGDIQGFVRGEEIASDEAGATPEYMWSSVGVDGTLTALTGTELKLANITYSELTGGEGSISLDDFLVADIYNLVEYEVTFFDASDEPLTEFVGFVNIPVVRNAWFTSEGTPSSGVIGALAADHVTAIDAKINNIVLGKILGNYEIDGVWYTVEFSNVDSEAKTATATAVPVEGILRSFCDLTITELNDSANLTEAIAELTVADALGYELGDDDRYYDKDGNLVTGMMRVLAGTPVGDLNVKIDDTYLGEVMGFTVEELPDGTLVFTDDEGNFATGLQATFATLKVGELGDSGKLTEAAKNVQVSDALGYTNDNGVWKDEEGNPVTGMMRVLAETRVGDLNVKIDNTYLGEVMGFTAKELPDGTVTFEDEDGNPATGLQATFATMKVGELDDSSKLTETAQNVQVSDALGYTKDNGTWFDEDGDPVTGIMAVLAEAKVGEISSKIDNLTVEDVFESETENGFLRLVDPDTKLVDLASVTTGLFDPNTGATVGEFMDAELLHFNDTTRENLTTIYGDESWMNLTLNEFLSDLINRLSASIS